jgi:cyclopropane-fatty-acyl-phospholipid synthase
MPPIKEMLDVLEPYDLSVLDVENLRLHYARTLQHWLDRFEKSADKIEQMFDARFVRAWRAYLSGSIAAFLTGATQLFQIVFTRGDNNEIPWTRDDIYRTG